LLAWCRDPDFPTTVEPDGSELGHVSLEELIQQSRQAPLTPAGQVATTSSGKRS
jgi:hypothetical protein